MGVAKTNTILKHPINKLFAVENTYHDTNQTDKASHREIFLLLAVIFVSVSFISFIYFI